MDDGRLGGMMKYLREFRVWWHHVQLRFIARKVRRRMQERRPERLQAIRDEFARERAEGGLWKRMQREQMAEAGRRRKVEAFWASIKTEDLPIMSSEEIDRKWKEWSVSHA